MDGMRIFLIYTKIYIWMVFLIISDVGIWDGTKTGAFMEKHGGGGCPFTCPYFHEDVPVKNRIMLFIFIDIYIYFFFFNTHILIYNLHIYIIFLRKSKITTLGRFAETVVTVRGKRHSILAFGPPKNTGMVVHC